METLQTIWTALSTPNEFLTNFFMIPASLVETYVSMLLFTTILNINSTKNQKLSYVIILWILSILSTYIISSPYDTIIHIILWPILVAVLLKTSIFKGIIAEFLPLIISVPTESIISNIYFSVFNISYEIAASTVIFRISIVIIVYLVIYLAYRLAKHFNFNISMLDNLDKRTKILLLLNFTLAFLAIITQFILITFFNSNLPIMITVLSTISLISYFIISMYSLYKTSQLQIATQNLEESQLYNKSLKILHDNVRAFKHDFSNIVQAIGGYISTDDLDGLKTYYSQLLSDCQQVNNLSTLSPDVINNPAIYSILASKYHKADSLGIKIKLEIFINLNELNVKIYEFTRILGILLDNAIEATKECDKKLIIVEFRKETSKNRQLVIIKNTYLEKDIDLNKIFEKGYSSKPNNTGLGLWEVREILKKNNNLNLYTSKTDELFSQQLEIYL